VKSGGRKRHTPEKTPQERAEARANGDAQKKVLLHAVHGFHKEELAWAQRKIISDQVCSSLTLTREPSSNIEKGRSIPPENWSIRGPERRDMNFLEGSLSFSSLRKVNLKPS